MPWWDDGSDQPDWQKPKPVVPPVMPAAPQPVAPAAPPVSTVMPPPAQPPGPWWDNGSAQPPAVSPVTPPPAQPAAPQVSPVTPEPWTPPPAPAWTPPPTPASAPEGAPAATKNPNIIEGSGVTNYVYEYSDGTRGNQPYRRGPDGKILLNEHGGILDEGVFLGSARQDGTISPDANTNVGLDGNVNTYDGYTSPTGTYYGNGGAPSNGWGRDVADFGNAAYQPGTPVTPGAVTPSNPNPGGAAFGGTAPGTGQGGGSGSGAGGGTPGGGSSASGGSITTGSTTGNTDRQVDAATETIEGRINGLMAQDAQGNYTNPVIQQAANNALMKMQSRGLLNSSMGIEAATQAAIAKAIEIAGPDAQTYFSQGRANQDVQNVFARDERGYQQDNYKLDKQQAHDMAKLDKELNNRLTVVGLEGSSRKEAEAIGRQHAIDMANSQAANSQYELTIRRISDIDNNKDMSEEAKVKLKNAAWSDFQYFMKMRGLVHETFPGDRYSTGKPKEETPDKPSPAGGSSAGGSSVPWWDQ